MCTTAYAGKACNGVHMYSAGSLLLCLVIRLLIYRAAAQPLVPLSQHHAGEPDMLVQLAGLGIIAGTSLWRMAAAAGLTVSAPILSILIGVLSYKIQLYNTHLYQSFGLFH
eukprot:GHRR01036970.1.p1 GENE.GHRR01036970.1~~GHRR01036970.1.p1  ORF type:complete len:111 (-),score=18.23 GHRR01036970.1:190-522(-)